MLSFFFIVYWKENTILHVILEVEYNKRRKTESDYLAKYILAEMSLLALNCMYYWAQVYSFFFFRPYLSYFISYSHSPYLVEKH